MAVNGYIGKVYYNSQTINSELYTQPNEAQRWVLKTISAIRRNTGIDPRHIKGEVQYMSDGIVDSNHTLACMFDIGNYWWVTPGKHAYLALTI